MNIQLWVVLGIWYALLVDVLGNYAGQRSPCWLPIIYGVVGVILFIHGLMIGRSYSRC